MPILQRLGDKHFAVTQQRHGDTLLSDTRYQVPGMQVWSKQSRCRNAHAIVLDDRRVGLAGWEKGSLGMFLIYQVPGSYYELVPATAVHTAHVAT